MSCICLSRVVNRSRQPAFLLSLCPVSACQESSSVLYLFVKSRQPAFLLSLCPVSVCQESSTGFSAVPVSCICLSRVVNRLFCCPCVLYLFVKSRQPAFLLSSCPVSVCQESSTGFSAVLVSCICLSRVVNRLFCCPCVLYLLFKSRQPAFLLSLCPVSVCQESSTGFSAVPVSCICLSRVVNRLFCCPRVLYLFVKSRQPAFLLSLCPVSACQESSTGFSVVLVSCICLSRVVNRLFCCPRVLYLFVKSRQPAFLLSPCPVPVILGAMCKAYSTSTRVFTPSPRDVAPEQSISHFLLYRPRDRNSLWRCVALCGRQEHRVFGLDPETQHEFVVMATNPRGECQLSEKLVLETEGV